MKSSSSPKKFTSAFLSILIVTLSSLYAISRVLESKLESFYIFDPPKLHALAQSAVALHSTTNDTRAIVDHIVAELAADPKLSPYLETREEWVFNNAGGAMGAMWILHASITEYLIIFGTAVGTEGHTGRHTADDYFHILSGTQLAYSPATSPFAVETYPAGSVHHLRRGEVKQYKMDSSCFALEYARGWIPPMIAFGYADTFSSTLDIPTLWDTSRLTAIQMVGNLLKGKF